MHEGFIEMVSFAAAQLIRDTFPARYIFNVISSKKIRRMEEKRTSLTHFKSGN